MTTMIIVSVPELTTFATLPVQSQVAINEKRMSFTAGRVPGTKVFAVKKLIQILSEIDATAAEVVAVVPTATVLYLAVLNNDLWSVIVPLHPSCALYLDNTAVPGVSHNWLGFPRIE